MSPVIRHSASILPTVRFIHEHARRSGFPATKVTEVRKMIDPVTAEA